MPKESREDPNQPSRAPKSRSRRMKGHRHHRRIRSAVELQRSLNELDETVASCGEDSRSASGSISSRSVKTDFGHSVQANRRFHFGNMEAVERELSSRSSRGARSVTSRRSDKSLEQTVSETILSSARSSSEGFLVSGSKARSPSTDDILRDLRQADFVAASEVLSLSGNLLPPMDLDEEPVLLPSADAGEQPDEWKPDWEAVDEEADMLQEPDWSKVKDVDISLQTPDWNTVRDADVSLQELDWSAVQKEDISLEKPDWVDQDANVSNQKSKWAVQEAVSLSQKLDMDTPNTSKTSFASTESTAQCSFFSDDQKTEWTDFGTNSKNPFDDFPSSSTFAADFERAWQRS